ncbi:MAG: BLUF domain-containing protein [Glaciecola sp.]
MIELVYMSQARHLFKGEELQALLRTSRINNTKHGITGMLLYDGSGTFIQAIEGNKEQIFALFELIKTDPRHTDVQELGVSNITNRSFPEWTMGFKRLDVDVISAVDGFNDFVENDNTINLKNSANSFAVDMLNHFKQSIS